MLLAFRFPRVRNVNPRRVSRSPALRPLRARKVPRMLVGRKAPSRFGVGKSGRMPLLPLAVPALARVRNFPTLALALGLILAALILDQGFGDEPLEELKELLKDWARANADTKEGPDFPPLWPVGNWNPAPIEGGRLTITGDIYEAVNNLETGGIDWVLKEPGHDFSGKVSVGGGISITVERVPVDTTGGFMDAYYNVNSAGVRRLIARVFGGYNLETRGIAVGVEPFPGGGPVAPFPLPPGERRTVPREIPEPLELPAPAKPPTVAPPWAPAPVDDPKPVPLPLPSPAPGVAPLAPSPRPLPAPAKMPALLPLPLPVPVREVLTDGLLAPLPAPDPLSTPTWHETPWPSGPAIGAPSSRPQATPEGIVKELGRIEQKLASIGGAGGLDLEAIIEALRGLLPDPPAYTFPSGSYSLEPVCEVDGRGVPIPARVVSWEGGSGELAEIREKLDAIAELFQVSKELRQPVCKGPPRTGGPPRVGQPVTVTFEEVT